MASFAQALPLQPGKTQARKEHVAQLTGPRRGEEEAFHRRTGTRREAAWSSGLPPLPEPLFDSWDPPPGGER